jgi:hypothetical protein
MKCDKCDDDAVSVNLTIPADGSLDPDAVQEIIGNMERYCLLHYNKVYGLTTEQEEVARALRVHRSQW